MKRAIFLATLALLAMLVFAPVAMAQDTQLAGDTQQAGQTTPAPGGGTQPGAPDLPRSGGPAILLPAAALLLGSGILTYAVLRRR
jgi:hypothetical protein